MWIIFASLFMIIKAKVKMEDSKEKKRGRVQKPSAQGRTKFTTSLQPTLIEWLKIHSIKIKKSPADILESLLEKYKLEQE